MVLTSIYVEVLQIAITIVTVTSGLFIINMLLHWAWAMIDDEKYKANDYITKKVISILPDMNSTTIRWIHEDGRIGWATFPIFLGILIMLAFALIWPIAITILTVYLILCTLRSGNRVRKNVSKLNKVAHDHDGKKIVRFEQ